MVTVVGELLAGGEAGGLADNLVALDDKLAAVRVLDDPLAAQQVTVCSEPLRMVMK